MSNDLVDLGFNKQVEKQTSMEAVGEARAIAEVQAAYVMAKKFPRNQLESYSAIIDACKRPFLAEQAFYSYPRGHALVTGPSIRLAEAIATNWGNIDCGVIEVSQSNGVSVAEAYAIDLQTNTKVKKIFHVKHERHSKKGVTRLTDPRDLYELVANQGARRLRACILGIVPGDVVEAAVEQCKKTLESSEIPLSDQIRKMVLAFDGLGVKVEHLEKRLGHKLEAIIIQEITGLKGIYKSLKDGMASREDFFDIGLGDKDQVVATELLEGLIADKKKKQLSSQVIADKETGEILNREEDNEKANTDQI